MPRTNSKHIHAKGDQTPKTKKIELISSKIARKSAPVTTGLKYRGMRYPKRITRPLLSIRER